MSHTKGEWFVRDFGGVFYSIGPKEKTIAGVCKDNENGKANARLIAAAPDLLAACKKGHMRLLELGQKESYQTVKILLAAIAKAEQVGE